MVIIRISYIFFVALLVGSLLAGCKSIDDKKSGEKIVKASLPPSYHVYAEKKYIESELLFDYERLSLQQSNLMVSSNYVYADESRSLNWIATSSRVLEVPLLADWSEYDTLKFAVYSENKTDSIVQLRFNNLRSTIETPMPPYFNRTLKIDFEGWKVFEIRFHELTGNYNPDWGAIASISFDCTGWGLEPNEKNVLYFSNIYLCKTEYEFFSEIPIDSSSLYQPVLDKWRAALVGETERYSKIPEYQRRVRVISEKCKLAWENFQRTFNKEENSAWNQHITHGKYGDEVKISIIYSNILAMAAGYGTVGSDFYQNEDLLADIKSALEYGYTYYYGDGTISKGIYGNWWYWDIGIPLNLTRTLVILNDELPVELIKKYLSPFDTLNPYPSMTACNKVWITYCVLASAFLQGDCERILIAKESLLDVFHYVSAGDGFYVDGSFVQHDKFAYTGGYGLSMLSEITNLLYVLGGTPFEFHDAQVVNHYNWIFDSFRPVIFEGNLFAALRGREVFRNTSEEIVQRVAVTSMIKMQDYAPADIQKKLEALIRHYMLSTGRNYAEDVPLPLVEYAVNLYKDRSVKPLKGYHVVKVFGNMDRVVQHTENYGVSLSFSSDRIYKYEAINNENMNGWYQGDGMIHLYTDGYDYNYGYYHYVNPYLLPGTTITGQRREERNLSKNILNSSPLAGGVEHGAYGIGVFELGYPKGNGVFESNIAARKSYFLFDNEIVAVGSGINDNSNTMVATVVENRLWREDDSLVADGVSQVLSESDEKLAGQYMHFTNMGGYVFLDGKTARYRKRTNTNSFLEIVLEHGKNPKNECYSYVYLPEATAKATKKYNRKPDVTILAQTETVHVVREKKLGLTGYVFFEADSAQGVSADNACAVMIESKNGRTVITVSDPSHLRDKITLTVELDDVDRIVACDEAIEAIISDGYVTLKVDTKDSDGGTFSIALK